MGTRRGGAGVEALNTNLPSAVASQWASRVLTELSVGTGEVH